MLLEYGRSNSMDKHIRAKIRAEEERKMLFATVKPLPDAEHQKEIDRKSELEHMRYHRFHTGWDHKNPEPEIPEETPSERRKAILRMLAISAIFVSAGIAWAAWDTSEDLFPDQAEITIPDQILHGCGFWRT